MDIYERLLVQLAGHKAVAKGPGNRKILVGTNPVAGAEVAVTDFVVPAGKIWVPDTFSLVCAQGATQTPTPALLWDDGTNVLGTSPGVTAPISVTTTTRLSWVKGIINPTAGAALTANQAPMPLIVLEPGFRLYTLTAGIGGNTDYAAPVLSYYEFTV